MLRNGTAEKRGQVARGSVHLILATRDIEVLDEVLKNLDGLGGLLAGDSGNGSSSRHFRQLLLTIQLKTNVEKRMEKDSQEKERKETRGKNEQKRSIRVSRVAAHENYVSENDAAA